MGTLITVIIILVVLSILVWAADRYLAMPFKGIIIFLMILVACIYMLHLAGVI
jgi:uncharacterized membrane protein YjdF